MLPPEIKINNTVVGVLGWQWLNMIGLDSLDLQAKVLSFRESEAWAFGVRKG